MDATPPTWAAAGRLMSGSVWLERGRAETGESGGTVERMRGENAQVNAPSEGKLVNADTYPALQRFPSSILRATNHRQWTSRVERRWLQRLDVRYRIQDLGIRGRSRHVSKVCKIKEEYKEAVPNGGNYKASHRILDHSCSRGWTKNKPSGILKKQADALSMCPPPPP